MTLPRITRVAREVLLTSSAVVGALCLLLTAIGFAFGIHPLLFRSGSMSPTISTGDIAFSHSVPASQVHRGDIVSVISDSGQRVTHRVIDTTGTGSRRLLTLKGDANKVIDPNVYDVTSVQRVLFHVPKVGYAVSWLSRAPGVYLVAAYVALMLLLIGRPGGNTQTPRKPVDEEEPEAVVEAPRVEPRGPSRVGRPVSALGVFAVLGMVFAAVLVWAMPTWAAWTSSVPITGQSLTTGTWGVPAAPTITSCTRNTSTGEITVTWSAVSGATSYNVKLSNPSSTLTNKTSPFTTTTIGKNNSGTVKIVAVNASGSSPDSVAWTYDGSGSNQACHA